MVAVNPTLFISYLLHYALNCFLHFSEKTYGSTFEKWTFSECPISDNTKTNLLFVIYILCGIYNDGKYATCIILYYTNYTRIGS